MELGVRGWEQRDVPNEDGNKKTSQEMAELELRRIREEFIAKRRDVPF